MATATWIKSELDGHGLAYEELHHSEAYTAQEVARREHVSGHCVAKVVIVMADSRPVELVLPASRRVVLERVAALLGAGEVRLASEEEMDRYFPDCVRGAIPALRHWDVDVLMDYSLRSQPRIVFQAGTHYDAVRMSFDDWLRLVNPQIASFSECEGQRRREEMEEDTGYEGWSD